MGSNGNQNPWTYDNYKDCSLGICSIYCPQFCYLIFPPPPKNDDSATPFSPLIIAIIGVLTSAFLLVSYYTVVTRYCKRRNVQTSAEEEDNPDAHNNSQWNATPAGLDEASIRNITVCKYQKGDGLTEGSECAVCLSEFQENENLRLLPKCEHAFHLPCIDTWLKSHSNCPLCRASVVSPAPPSHSQVLATVNEIQRPDDLILVVDDQERNCDVVLSMFGENNNDRDHEDDENGARRKRFRRSISLGTFPCKPQLLISDIMKIDEDLQMGSDESWKEVGSSKGCSVAMKRSVSTGGFKFDVHDKGKNTILPS